MFKNYFKKKSKVGLVIDAAILILVIFMLIPGTRKDVTALIMRPTLIFHQPKVNKDKPKLAENSYNWELISPTGKVVELSSMSDKVMFINLWASWCAPCIAEMPDMERLYKEYGDDINFLFISNEDEKEMRNFINAKGYDIPVFTPVTKYPGDFNVNSLPTTYIISKDGEVIIKKSGVAKWNSSKVKKILDALIAK